MLTCWQYPMLEGSCNKYGVEYLMLFLFGVSMFTSSLLKFDLFNAFNLNNELFCWIALVQLAKCLTIYNLTWCKINALSS